MRNDGTKIIQAIKEALKYYDPEEIKELMKNYIKSKKGVAIKK